VEGLGVGVGVGHGVRVVLATATATAATAGVDAETRRGEVDSSSASASASSSASGSGHEASSSYDTWRMLAGLCEGREVSGRIPLEVNMDFTRHISFKKGCYVGQELISRTKHKGVVRKRAIPFIFESNTSTNTTTGKQPTTATTPFHFCALSTEDENKARSSSNTTHTPIDGPSPGTPVLVRLVDGTSRPCGEVVATDGRGVGIALVRLADLVDSNVLSFAVASSGTDGGAEARGTTHAMPIRPFRPAWWLDTDPVNGKPVIQ